MRRIVDTRDQSGQGAYHASGQYFLCAWMGSGNAARNSFLQQQLGGLDEGLSVEPLLHDPVVE